MGPRLLFPRLLLLASSACVGNAAAQQGSLPKPPAKASVAEQYLFSAANGERVARGLPALRWDEALSSAAISHARLMAELGQISHQFPREPELADRSGNAGARFSRITENVAEASTAVIIHDLWMHSQGHRENLLDAAVDRVAIAVVSRGGQLFAVEDFERSVQTLSFEEQERTLHRLLTPFGLQVSEGQEEARQTCAADTGSVGERRAAFVMRFTATDLTQLPAILKQKLRSGRFREASVGACPAEKSGDFSTYRVAVLLYL